MKEEEMKRQTEWLIGVLTGLLFSALSCTAVLAQSTAQINGTVKDPSGAVLPGVEVTVTQTETGVTRSTITNETGSFALPNLALGPYRLEAGLPGFRTFVQTGVVLQVNSSPVINPVVGVGQVVENTRIMELPLNGRNVVELIALAGAASPASISSGGGSAESYGKDPFIKTAVSVAGGSSTGLYYSLDGAFHNNPFDNG